MEKLLKKQIVLLTILAGVFAATGALVPVQSYTASAEGWSGNVDPQDGEYVLTDGQDSGVWEDRMVNYYLYGLENPNVEIVFDFGSSQSVQSASISYFAYSGFGLEAPGAEFYFSTDGETYTGPATYTTTNEYVTGEAMHGIQGYNFDEYNARYVKIVLTPGGDKPEIPLSEVSFSDILIPEPATLIIMGIGLVFTKRRLS